MGTRIEQLERQVEVLREAILGPTAADFGTRFAAVEAADRIAAEPVEATVPAPTWRPIAEMPAEWRDGRLVAIADAECCSLSRYEDGDWAEDSTLYTGNAYVTAPTHYLTITIPEVPRG